METKTDLLIRVAELYYQQGLNQNSIAELLGTSRPTVSRMIEEAKEVGIVEIIVHSPIKKDHPLSLDIRTQLQLKEAIVVSGEYNYHKGLERCGVAASHFLNTILNNNMTIGITWGPATQCLCDAMEYKEYYNINVVQMVGCLGTGNPHFDGLELALNLSKKLNGVYSNIYAPIYVDSEIVHSYLVSDPQIESTMKKALHADIILTGIGAICDDSSTLRASGYITKEDTNQLIQKGAVGHLLARMFDKNGNEVFIDGKYTIAAPLSAMNNAIWSIGISASEMKAEAVLAAVRSGYINTLVIDELLAHKLLELISAENL